MSETLKIIGIISAYILVLLIVYLLYMAVIPVLNFSVYFEWWNKHKPKETVPSCFDMLSLAYYEKFMLYYHLRTQLLPAESAFADGSWVTLIKTIMYGGAVDYTTNPDAGDNSPNDYYYVFPKDLCVSVIPETMQSDTSKSWPKGSKRSEWQDIMLKWGGVSNGTSNSDWIKFLGGDQTKTYSDIVNATEWQNNIDNFLWTKYQIPADSPMVVAYLTNFATYNGDTMYPALLQFLLGGGTGAGGWWGFCQAGGNFGGRGYAEISRQIWADEVVGKFTNPSKAKPSCGSASTIGTIATSALTIGALGFMTGGGALAVGGLTVLGTGVGFLQSGCL